MSPSAAGAGAALGEVASDDEAGASALELAGAAADEAEETADDAAGALALLDDATGSSSPPQAAAVRARPTVIAISEREVLLVRNVIETFPNWGPPASFPVARKVPYVLS